MPTTSMPVPKDFRALYWTPERSGRVTIIRLRAPSWSTPWIIVIDGVSREESYATQQQAAAFAFGYVDEMRKP